MRDAWVGLTVAWILGCGVPDGFLLSSFAQTHSDQQPVARFDPTQPVRLRVINRTPHPLEYGLTDPRPQVTEVQAGEQIELTQVRIPNCLGINTPMLAPVRYQVSRQDGNWIQVEVRVSPEIYGEHCLDLRQDGEIYVY